MIKDNNKFNEEVKVNTNFLDELKINLPEYFSYQSSEIDGELKEIEYFDIEKFKKSLRENNINEIKEGYQLSFIGKDYAKKQVGEKPSTVIVPDKEHNNKELNKNSGNLFFTGDNLEVLQHLQNNYSKSIDMIYIDPPYNTGKDGFVYPDKFEYSDDVLQDIFGLTEKELGKLKSIEGTSTHSAWLTFMYPRLALSRKLLKDSGVIFVSIDDNEVTNLSLIMDEIFSEYNRVALLPTVMNLKGNQDQFGFAGTHEYTLVYAKDINMFIPGELLIEKEIIEKDWIKDEVGWYKRGAGLVATGVDSPREKRPYLWYPILIDDHNILSLPTEMEIAKLYDSENNIFNDDFKSLITSEYEQKGFNVVWPMSKGRFARWRWGSEKMRSDHEDIIISKTKTSYSLSKKQRPTNIGLPSVKPKSFFYKSEYSSGNGTRELENLFNKEALFSNPKPIELIKDFIRIGAPNIDISAPKLILDFFAGSSTTADAVLQLNAEDNASRKFIMVQIDELTFELDKNNNKKPAKGNEAAFNAGYMSLDEISRERIKLSSKKIVENNRKLLLNDFDAGFKHYQFISPSQPTINDLESYDLESGMFTDHSGNLVFLSESGFDDMIKPFASQALKVLGNSTGVDSILTTWLVEDGYKFDIEISELDLGGYKSYLAEDSIIYLIDEGWTSNNTRTLLNSIARFEIKVQTIVIYGYSFDLESLRELELGLSQLPINVTLVKRY